MSLAKSTANENKCPLNQFSFTLLKCKYPDGPDEFSESIFDFFERKTPFEPLIDIDEATIKMLICFVF